MALLSIEVLPSGAIVEHDLAKGPLRVGRAPGNELRLEHPLVSSFHAVVAQTGSGAQVMDLRSTNGTLVDGQPVGRGVRLGSSSLLSFGGCEVYLRVRGGGATQGGFATTLQADSVFPYAVEATLDGDRGPQATVRDLLQGTQHRVNSENRAVLLFLLARELSRSRQRDERAGGWCADEDLRVGIWGPAARGHAPNNLNVLVRRTRLELQERGFDGACLEKVGGYARLCVREAQAS